MSIDAAIEAISIFLDSYFPSQLRYVALGALVMAAVTHHLTRIRDRDRVTLEGELRSELAVLQAQLTAAGTRETVLLQGHIDRQQNATDAVQTALLAGVSHRAAVLATRRLDAADRLWAAFRDLTKLTLAAQSLTIFQPGGAIATARTGPQAQAYFRDLIHPDAHTSPAHAAAMQQRVFVTEAVWRAFWAYNSIVLWAIAKCQLLGAGRFDISPKTAVMRAAVLAALPHREPTFPEGDEESAGFFLNELEELLLKELRAFVMLTGDRAIDLEQAVGVAQETAAAMPGTGADPLPAAAADHLRDPLA